MIRLKSVEFWRDVRGPGPRNQGDATTTYSVEKVKPGTMEPSPSGYTILWDRAAHAVLIAKDGATEAPLVIYVWENVRRAIPVDPADLADVVKPSEPSEPAAPPEVREPAEPRRGWSEARRQAHQRRKAEGG